MKKNISFLILSPFIFLGMGCLLLYFLVHIRIKRTRSFFVPHPSGNAAAKLKIALIAKEFPPQPSNLGAFTAETARALVALGHQVHVVTMGEEGCDQQAEGYWIHRISPAAPWFFSYIKLAGFSEAGDHLAHSYLVNRRLVGLQKKFKFDVIEFPDTRAEGFYYYLQRSHPPFVVRFHTSEGFNHQLSARPFNLDRLWVRTMERYSIVRAKAVIGVSNDIVKKYEYFYHLDFSGAPIIPYPLGSEWFDDSKITSSEPSSTVLFAGPFELHSGPHILLQAIPKILEICPSARFIFAGPTGGLRKYCDEIIADSGISQRVTFIEPLSHDQLVEHYRNAAVCVFPALWENYPYPCLEAMATGCPVVASNVGGFRDIIENRVNGLLVAAGDSEVLAEAVTEVLTDDEFRLNIGQSSPIRIRQICDSQQVAESSLKVYRGVINK